MLSLYSMAASAKKIKLFVLDLFDALFCRRLSGSNYSSRVACKCVNTQRFSTKSQFPWSPWCAQWLNAQNKMIIVGVDISGQHA